CHGAGKPMAGLDLRTSTAALKGSQNGPVIVEGFSERSLLIRRVAAHSMPPAASGQPLTEPEIRTLRGWIDHGHFTQGGDPDSSDRPFTKLEAPEITAGQRAFWAFKKPANSPVPKPRAAGRVRTPIDAFLLSRLESQGLSFSADAPKQAL